VKRLAVVVAMAAALVAPAVAEAHPLGNFTVNRAAEITTSGNHLYLRAVLDLAEIPTFQEGDGVRAPGFADRLKRSLVLEVDGGRAELRTLARQVQERPGAGGLPTLRFEAVYDAGRAGRSLSFHDTSFPGRIGWREIVVRADHGAAILSSGVPATSPSRLLHTYPRDLLGTPVNLRTARAGVRPGDAPGVAPALTGAAPPRAGGRFESLVAHDLSFGFVVVSLALALFWGAAHALGPGHGKAIVAGYLIGTRGRPRDAVALGGIVTVTHTAGVFALGLVTLALSEFLVPEQLYPWLNLVSAVLVLGVGLAILRGRLRSRHGHAHHHGHDHDHEHGHHHHDEHRQGLLGIGVSAGIVPCPTALVVLLAAISLHRIGYGLVLIVAFSLGLAATVTGIGLIAVTAKRAFGRLSFEGGLVRALPAASAVVVIGLGLAMTLRALPEVF
jgi:ABC-type nickel/cobalt efflux system permease component RcnA